MCSLHLHNNSRLLRTLPLPRILHQLRHPLTRSSHIQMMQSLESNPRLRIKKMMGSQMRKSRNLQMLNQSQQMHSRSQQNLQSSLKQPRKMVNRHLRKQCISRSKKMMLILRHSRKNWRLYQHRLLPPRRRTKWSSIWCHACSSLRKPSKLRKRWSLMSVQIESA